MIKFKAGESDDVAITLLDANGPVNLTEAELSLVIALTKGGEPLISKEDIDIVRVDEVNGEISFRAAVPALTVPGDYLLEMKAVWPTKTLISYQDKVVRIVQAVGA